MSEIEMRPHDVDELRNLERLGYHFDICFFWGHRPTPGGDVGPGCLSHWWLARFAVAGIVYPTAEHFMMAGKARMFGDDNALSRILNTPSPREAKMLGRSVHGYDEERWIAHRYAIVVDGNFAKFSQNPTLRTYLLGTGSRLLAEASPTDHIWGIGLSAQDQRARMPSQWRGTNLLGFALMDVRGRLAG